MTRRTGLLVTGLALLAGYFLVAAGMDYFIDPDLDYHSMFSYQPIGSVRRYQDRDFAKHHLLSAVWKGLLLFPATLCLSLYLAMGPMRDRIRRMLERLARVDSRKVLACIGLAVVVLTYLIGHFVLQEQPVYDDERAYEFQGRLLRHGMLYAEMPPSPASFENVWIILREGKWLGKYTPGHPAIIALGLFLGDPRLIIILLAALTPLLVYHIGRDRYDERVGLLAAALFAVSPAFLFTSSTLMNHTTLLFFVALFTLSYFRTVEGRSLLYAPLAGAALGAALLVRPQDAVGYGAAFALWSVLMLIQERRKALWGRFALMLLFFAILAGVLLLYNKAITGKCLYLTHRYYRPEALYGFGSSDARSYVHTPFRGALNFFINVARMNLWLFGWPFSLLFVVLYFASGSNVQKDRIFLGVVVTVCTVYWLSAVAGVAELGARYYFTLLIPLLLWTARCLLSLHKKLCERFPDWDGSRTAVPAFVVLSVLLAAATFGAEKTIHFRELSSRIMEPYARVEAAKLKKAIVQVYSLPPTGWVFGYRLPETPDLGDDVIYVRAKKPGQLLQLLKAMPERKLYALLYEKESDEIIFGPLAKKFVREQAKVEAAESEISADGQDLP